MDVHAYISELQRQLSSGIAKEHAYRPALKSLFEATGLVIAINDPKRSEHGNPDFVLQDIQNRLLIRGYGESKDIDVDLDTIEKGEQLRRYLGYSNLVLTNGLDFRFFKNGERYFSIRIGHLEYGRIETDEDNLVLLWEELKNFLQSPPEKIKSAVRLSEIMGGKARRIRENINIFLKREEDERNVEIEKMYAVIKDLLVHDLSVEKFADMYAQTLVYGLFIARFHDKTLDSFTRQEARDLVPASNPFLRQFFDHIAGSQFDKRLAYIVDELCAVFEVSDIKTIIKHHYKQGTLFENETPIKDPIIHFYEDFLKEYDPELKKKMGAYYTPIPVVRYIVRSVDEIIKTRFDLSKGLADNSYLTRSVFLHGSKVKESLHRVQILDPAVGTATFLNELIKYIYENNFKGQEGLWSSYVEEDLIPRLYGFELMMAPYTIAHLKLALTLKELGYDKEFSRRLGIYLTNTLEEGIKRQLDLLSFGLQEAISKEAQAASEIKHHKPIMVIIGNPPYSINSNNKSDYILNLIKDYKKNLNERKINLDDDYIKFIRFSEELISKNGEGIVAMITNNSFIDGITHRQMRKHLLESFDEIYILDLHGNSKKKERSPDGGKDENVFSIQQGVSINIFVKRNNGSKKNTEVFHSEIYGKQKSKFQQLSTLKLSTTNWNKLNPTKPNYFFVPKDFDLTDEYKNGFSLNELFIKFNSGIQTKRDSLVYKFKEEEVQSVIKDFANLDVEQLRTNYKLPADGRDWTVRTAKEDIVNSAGQITKILYHPFDFRYTYYSGKAKGFMAYPRSPLMLNMLRDNIALLLVRNSRRGNVNNFLLSDKIVDKDGISPFDNVRFFPLYLYHEDGTKTLNLNEPLLKKIIKKAGEANEVDILDYIYAYLYSKTYLNRYSEFIKIDYPRIPYPQNKEQFWQLAEKGKKLRELHLMRDEELSNFISSFPIIGTDIISDYKFIDNRIHINDKQYFGNVSQTTWNMTIGGYQPLQKWLKDRKGKKLTATEIEFYQKLIKVLVKTEEISKEIDETVTSGFYKPSLNVTTTALQS